MDLDTLTIEIYTKIKAAATEGNMLPYAGELARKILQGNATRTSNTEGELIPSTRRNNEAPVRQVRREEIEIPTVTQTRATERVATRITDGVRVRTDL